jgi:hypothetical protein
MLCLLIGVAAVTACSLTEPFIDRRRNAGAKDQQHLYVGRSQPDKPAICYNGLWTSEETLQTMADEACRKNAPDTHAVKTNDESFTCRLLLPSCAYYECVPDNEDQN